MSNSFWDYPIAAIEKALAIRKQIETLKQTVEAIMGGTSPGAPGGQVAKRRGRPPKTAPVESGTGKVDGRKGKRSPATIAKMKAAQQARWAKKNGASPAPDEPAMKAKKKRTMSPEGRARIAAAQKARWAKRKA